MAPLHLLKGLIMSDTTLDEDNDKVRIYLRDRLHAQLLNEDQTTEPDLEKVKTLLQIVDSSDKLKIARRRIRNEEVVGQSDAQYKATLARLLIEDSNLLPKLTNTKPPSVLPEDIECPPLVNDELSNEYIQENFDDFHKRLEGDTE